MYRQRSIAVPEVVCCCESSGGQILRHETGVALGLAWYQSVCLSEYTRRLFNYPSILFLHYKLANRYTTLPFTRYNPLLFVSFNPYPTNVENRVSS